MQMIEYRPADVGGLVDVARLIQQAKMNAFNRNLAKVEAGHKYDDADMFAQGAEGLTGKEYPTSTAPPAEVGPYAFMSETDMRDTAAQRVASDTIKKLLNVQPTTSERKMTAPEFNQWAQGKEGQALDSLLSGNTSLMGKPAMQYDKAEIDRWRRFTGAKTPAQASGVLKDVLRAEAPTVSVVNASDQTAQFNKGMREGYGDALGQIDDKKAQEIESIARGVSRVDADSSPLNYRRYANKVNTVIDWEDKAMARAASDAERAAIRDRANRMLEATEQQFGYLHRTFQDDNRNPYADRLKRRAGGSGKEKYVYLYDTNGQYKKSELESRYLSNIDTYNKQGLYARNPETGAPTTVEGQRIKNVEGRQYLDDDALARLEGGQTPPATAQGDPFSGRKPGDIYSAGGRRWRFLGYVNGAPKAEPAD